MKRTTGQIILAAFLERDMAIHHIDDIDAGQELIDKILRNHLGISGREPP
ncbi:hypothetical protein [Paludibacterium paludis]|nr:hypothetical protein [Paludibacterium paludis]